MSNRPFTRGQAINAFCKECIYDPRGGAGTWRQQVEACTSTNCPLYDFRPLSKGGPEGSHREEDDRPVEAEKEGLSQPETTETDSMEQAV